MNGLGSIRGNARGCLVYEPMFLLPYSLFLPYASLFMLEQGIDEIRIGWITTVGLTMQILTSLFSGYLTDRLGRKRALLFFDLLSWSAATLLWAVSHQFIHFLIAAMLNSFSRIPNTAWHCLLVEDTEPRDRGIVYSVLQLVGVVSALFAPIGALLVERFSLVPAVRIMYLFAFVSMTFMFFGRNHALRETKIGILKREEHARLIWSSIWRDNVQVIRSITANRLLLILFLVYTLNEFQTALKNTYLSIYLIQVLHFENTSVGLLPVVTSLTTLIIWFFFMKKGAFANVQRALLYGFACSAVSCLIFILMPDQNWTFLVAGTMIGASGTVLALPALEAAIANSIEDERRAGSLSVLSVLVLVLTAPSGIIGGWSFTLDPRLPLWFMVSAFILALALLVWGKLLNKNTFVAHLEKIDG